MGATKEKEHQKVVTISGNTQVESSLYYDAIGADEKKWYEPWKDNTVWISDSNAKDLDERVEEFLDSKGFYRSKVSVSQTSDSVDITVDEGEPVKVGKIKIDSDYDIDELVTFESGENFEASKFVKIKSDVKRALLEDGYCNYKFKSKAYVDLDSHDVAVKYKLAKGELCYFGDTSFEGRPDNVSKDVLRSRLMYRPGEVFSIKRIESSIASMNQLDTFETVMLSPTEEQNSSVVDMELTLSEKEKLSVIKAGAGYDTSVGPRAQIFYERRNFLGNARKLTLSGTIAQKEKIAEISLLSPAVMAFGDSYMDLYTNLGYSNNNYDTYDEKKGYFDMKLGYERDDFYFYAGLGLENIDIEKTKVDPSIIAGSFRLFYPFIEFVYDGRDSKVDPKNGYYFSAYSEYGLQNEKESSKYLKFLLEGRAIKSFGELTLSGVGKIGVIDIDNGALPASKLFYAGGEYSNRAYGVHDIGIVESDSSSSSLGGKSWGNLSLEANYKLRDKLYGAVFWDATMINKNSYDFSGDIINAVGVGIRYKTGVGPLKFDIGVNPNNTDDYGIHFQIGQSF